ncbi:MAG: FG-GAP-like repeat-containing protein [Verrucomicrobiota bacterium]|nr:FG-GAP-like repeat-containing protein [Verrucomicrobiota bacterium]
MRFLRLVLLQSLFSLALFAADSVPKITLQPVSQAALAGSPVTFRVTASGGTLNYQWKFDGIDVGLSSNSLVITNVQPEKVGNYFVVITNSTGSITSSIARLKIVSGFTLATNSVIAKTGGQPVGAAWGDFNGDGWVDMVANLLNRTGYFVYTNDRSGGFISVPNSIFKGGTQAGRAGTAWADYDNDGRLDLAICAATGPRVFIYHQEPDGFTLETNAVFLTPNLQTFSCAWGDYDNDGNVDLFVSDSTPSFGGANDLLFRNLGNRRFEKVTSRPPVNDNAVGQGAVWGDYDGDGYLDLFVTSLSNQKNILYKNLDGTNFFRTTNNAVVAAGGNSGGPAWGDYDNDGDLDLFVSNFTPQNALLYRNEGNGHFTSITNDIIVRDGPSAGSIWVDFDNDGWLDLVSAAAKTLVYLNNGDGSFSKVVTGGLVSKTYASWGNNSFASADVNQDGFQDLLNVNFNGSNELFYNDGNSNSWVIFRLEGRASNRSAIGAKVRAYAEINGREVQQLRVISGGGQYFAQSELAAAFGLGDAERVNRVMIEWPSGVRQELHNIHSRQIINIIEPPKLKLSINQQLIEGVHLIGSAAHQYVPSFSTNLQTWVDGEPIPAGLYSPSNFFPLPGNPSQFLRVRELPHP